jgi:hypothetical protein
MSKNKGMCVLFTDLNASVQYVLWTMKSENKLNNTNNSSITCQVYKPLTTKKSFKMFRYADSKNSTR